MHEYLFAWNAHSVNMGSWASFIPTASPDHQSRYAEALLWGIPMYTYFCIGVAIVRHAVRHDGCARAIPGISNVRALGISVVIAFVFDVVIENLVIRLGHGYAFARTPRRSRSTPARSSSSRSTRCSAWRLLGVLFTATAAERAGLARRALLRRARRFDRLRPRLQSPARWFAVIGWAIVTCSSSTTCRSSSSARPGTRWRTCRPT